MIKNYILRNKQVLNSDFKSKTDYETKQKSYYDAYFNALVTNGLYNDLTQDQLQKLNQNYCDQYEQPLYKYQNYCEVSDPNFQQNDYISLTKLEMQNLHQTSGFIQVEIEQKLTNTDKTTFYKISYANVELQKFQQPLDLVFNFSDAFIQIYDPTDITQTVQNNLGSFIQLKYTDKQYQIVLSDENQNNLIKYNIVKVTIKSTGNLQNLLGCYSTINLLFDSSLISLSYNLNEQYVFMKIETKTGLASDALQIYKFSKRNTSYIQYLILESDQVNGNLVCQQDKINNQTYSTFNQNTLAVISPQELFQYDNQFNDVHLPLTQSSEYMQFKLFDQTNNEFDQDVFQIQIQLYQQKVFQGYSSSDSVNKSLELHQKKQSFIKLDNLSNDIYFNNFQASKISISKINGYTNTCCVEGDKFYLSIYDTVTNTVTQQVQFDVTETIWNQDFVDKICQQMKQYLFVKTHEFCKGQFITNGTDNFIKFYIYVNLDERNNHQIGFSSNTNYNDNVAYQIFENDEIYELNDKFNFDSTYKITNNKLEQQIIEMYCKEVGSNVNEQLFSTFTNYDNVFQKCDSAFIWKDVQNKSNKFNFVINQFVKNQQTNQYEKIQSSDEQYIKNTNINYLIIRLLVK